MTASALAWCGLPLALLALARAPCARAAHGPRALEASILGSEELGKDYSLEGDHWLEENYQKQRHRSHHAVAVQAKGQLQGSIAQESSSRKVILTGGNASAGNESAGNASASAGNASNASGSADDDSSLDSPVLSDPEVRGIEREEVVLAHALTLRTVLSFIFDFLIFWVIGAAVIIHVHRTKYKATWDCATALCCCCCFPCGLLSLCFPMDEETPRTPMPILVLPPRAAPDTVAAAPAEPAQSTSATAEPGQAKAAA